MTGEPDPETGFCVDLGELDAVLRDAVLEPLDHRHLNHDVEDFAPGRLVPTTENLVIWIWDRLQPRLGTSLRRLRLYEDETLWVEYGGTDESG